MVNDVELDDAVEEVLANPAKLAVDSGQSALHESPVLGVVVGDLNVGVVEVGDSNCSWLALPKHQFLVFYLPSQWCTHMYGWTYKSRVFPVPTTPESM